MGAVGPTFAAAATETHYTKPFYATESGIDDCTGLAFTIVFQGTDVGTLVDTSTTHHNSVHYTGTITVAVENGAWGTGTEHFVVAYNVGPNFVGYHSVDYQTIAIYDVNGDFLYSVSFRDTFTFNASGGIDRVVHEHFKQTGGC